MTFQKRGVTIGKTCIWTFYYLEGLYTKQAMLLKRETGVVSASIVNIHFVTFYIANNFRSAPAVGGTKQQNLRLSFNPVIMVEFANWQLYWSNLQVVICIPELEIIDLRIDSDKYSQIEQTEFTTPMK